MAIVDHHVLHAAQAVNDHLVDALEQSVKKKHDLDLTPYLEVQKILFFLTCCWPPDHMFVQCRCAGSIAEKENECHDVWKLEGGRLLCTTRTNIKIL